MIKLTTLIKAYKLALSSIYEKVENWNTIYLKSVSLPNTDDLPGDTIVFTFSNNSKFQPGALAISISLSIYSVERFKGGLNYLEVEKELITSKTPINDIGRFLLILFHLMDQIKVLFSEESVDDIVVESIDFDLDRDLFIFNIASKSGNKVTICTDERLSLFGDTKSL